MEILAEAEKYTLYWEDDAKTIIRLDIERGWTWDDAHIAMKMMDEIIPSVGHDVYTVYFFKPGAAALPKKFAMSNIRTLLDNEVENEKMFILVGSQSLITKFISMLTKVYGNLTHNASKIQYAKNMDEAYSIIQENKRTLA